MGAINVLRRGEQGDEELYLGAFVQPNSENEGFSNVDLGFGSQILNSADYLWMGVGGMCAICFTTMLVLAINLRKNLRGEWTRAQRYARKVTQGKIPFPSRTTSSRQDPAASASVTASSSAAESKSADGDETDVDNFDISQFQFPDDHEVISDKNTKSSTSSKRPRKRFGGILGKKMRV